MSSPESSFKSSNRSQEIKKEQSKFWDINQSPIARAITQSEDPKRVLANLANRIPSLGLAVGAALLTGTSAINPEAFAQNPKAVSPTADRVEGAKTITAPNFSSAIKEIKQGESIQDFARSWLLKTQSGNSNEPVKEHIKVLASALTEAGYNNADDIKKISNQDQVKLMEKLGDNQSVVKAIPNFAKYLDNINTNFERNLQILQAAGVKTAPTVVSPKATNPSTPTKIPQQAVTQKTQVKPNPIQKQGVIGNVSNPTEAKAFKAEFKNLDAIISSLRTVQPIEFQSPDNFIKAKTILMETKQQLDGGFGNQLKDPINIKVLRNKISEIDNLYQTKAETYNKQMVAYLERSVDELSQIKAAVNGLTVEFANIEGFKQKSEIIKNNAWNLSNNSTLNIQSKESTGRIAYEISKKDYEIKQLADAKLKQSQ